MEGGHPAICHSGRKAMTTPVIGSFSPIKDRINPQMYGVSNT